MKNYRAFTIMGSLILLTGCMTPAEHAKSLPSTQEREMTVGVVQKEIHAGMSQADVAAALGSPNIVTKDSAGKETWIYDKVASEAAYSQREGGVWLILGAVSGSTGAVATTQKTLTVIIKFDDNKAVESFSYHGSKF